MVNLLREIGYSYEAAGTVNAKCLAPLSCTSMAIAAASSATRMLNIIIIYNTHCTYVFFPHNLITLLFKVYKLEG